MFLAAKGPLEHGKLKQQWQLLGKAQALRRGMDLYYILNSSSNSVLKDNWNALAFQKLNCKYFINKNDMSLMIGFWPVFNLYNRGVDTGFLNKEINIYNSS